MKVVGKQSVASVTKIALVSMMVITVGLLITLPWVITYYLKISYHMVNVYAKTVLLVMLYPCGILGFLIENELKKMFRTLETENPFVQENVKSLNRMGGYMVIVLALFIFKMIMLNTVMTMVCGFACIIIALFCFVLSDVFRQAVQYKQDNDLTI
jgi:hypothetical protein